MNSIGLASSHQERAVRAVRPTSAGVLSIQGILDGGVSTPSPSTLLRLQRRAVKAFAEGDLDGAQHLFEQALTIAEQIHANNHHTIGLLMILLARVYRAKGEMAEATMLRDKGQSILKFGVCAEPAGGSSGFWSLLGY